MKNAKVTYIMMADGSINVFIGNQSYVVANDHINYRKIKSNLMKGRMSGLEKLINVRTGVEYFHKDVEITGEKFTFRGEEMHGALVERIIGLVVEEADPVFFVNFMQNLMDNPSNRAVNELYGFLEGCKLPITEDGCFLAYKKVTYNYKDLHTRTFDNSLGAEVRIARNKVNDDASQTCSYGLHVCSFGYLDHFGGTGTDDVDDRVIVVKVNPADVVSVPTDYDNQKMRVCRYEVIDEVENDGLTSTVNWVYGNRNIGFIRDTIKTLKELAISMFGLESAPSFEENMAAKSLTNRQKEEYLDEVRDLFMGDTSPEMFDPDFEFTIKNLLQWVSNWTVVAPPEGSED